MLIKGSVVPRPFPYSLLNTLRPRQNGGHFPDDIFKCIFLFENAWIWISLKFVPKVRVNNIPALVQIMAWRRIGDKPLSEPMMVNLVTHICVTRLQWVKCYNVLFIHLFIHLYCFHCFVYCCFIFSASSDRQICLNYLIIIFELRSVVWVNKCIYVNIYIYTHICVCMIYSNQTIHNMTMCIC